MTNDTRCCGSGACIIDPEGRCWCGQQWDGDAMDQVIEAEHTGDVEHSASKPND